MFSFSLPESKCNFVCLSTALYGKGLTSSALMRQQCVLSAPRFSVGVYLHSLFAYWTAWLLPWEKKLFVASDVMAMSLAIASDMLYLCALLLLTRLGFSSHVPVSLFPPRQSFHTEIYIYRKYNKLSLYMISVCLLFKHRWILGLRNK